MKLTVKISDCKITNSQDDIIVTHGLGSCIGLVLYEPKLKIAGMLHYMLPLAGKNIKEPKFNPYQYGDSGIQVMIKKMEQLGCTRSHLKVIMAGGAAINAQESGDFFAIGKRNHTVARKVFWKLQMLITNEHTGGNISRSMYFDMKSGTCWFTSKGQRYDLYGGQ